MLNILSGLQRLIRRDTRGQAPTCGRYPVSSGVMPRPKKAGEKLSKRVDFMLEPRVHAAAERAADGKGESVAQWIRRWIRAGLEAEDVTIRPARRRRR